MKYSILVAWALAVNPAIADEPTKFQLPCSFFVNKVLDIINFPWSNQDLAPCRILKVLQWQK
jgi:hypothetical protein